jgi:hypothetical protein
MLAPIQDTKDSAKGKREQDISLLGGIVDILDDYKASSPTDKLPSPSSASTRSSPATNSSSSDKISTIGKSKKESKKVKQAIEDSLPEPEVKALMERLCLHENGFDLINERIKLSCLVSKKEGNGRGGICGKDIKDCKLFCATGSG